MSEKRLTVAASITESYSFLASHITHFLRLSYGPLMLWIMVKIGEQILAREYGQKIPGNILLHFLTASFALVWYRQFLLGSKHATYGILLRLGLGGDGLSWPRLGRLALRIIILTLALLIPTLILSISTMLYYQGQGVQFSDRAINMLAIKSTFVVMLIFSPILIRLSFYTAGLALGRKALSFARVWKQTRGYTVTLWWVTFRAFLPLVVYNYIITLLLRKLIVQIPLSYIASTLILELVAGFLTLIMLAIVVGANAEAFRILIGVRAYDTPHRSPNTHKAIGKSQPPPGKPCKRKS